MEFIRELFNPLQLANHVVGCIISLTISCIFLILRKSIMESPLPQAKKRKLIKMVNDQILDRLFYMIDNGKYVNKVLIYRIRYLYAKNSRLKVKDVISEDQILVKLITHITASEVLTVNEKINMINGIYSNIDRIHIASVEVFLLRIICTIIIFIIVNATLHIRNVCQSAYLLFGSYTEPLIIIISAIFSILICHYAYMEYINHKSLQQIKLR